MTKLAAEVTGSTKKIIIEKLFLQRSSKADDCNAFKIILEMEKIMNILKSLKLENIDTKV